MALHLKLKPKTLTPLRPLRPFSSSPPPPPSDGVDASENDPSGTADAPAAPPPPSLTSSFSYFGDIKQRLKSAPTPPRQIPTDPLPPPLFSGNQSPPASFEDISKRLSSFRLKSTPSPSGDRPPSPATISFQELLKNSMQKKTPAGPSKRSPAAGEKGGESLSFDAIRDSLRQFRSSTKEQTSTPRVDSLFSLQGFKESLRDPDKGPKSSSVLTEDSLPSKIFGPELKEKADGDTESKKALKTEFVKMYNHDELGEKLRRLRPEAAARCDKDWFSLTELNERLVKLREMEEKETENRMGGFSFNDLRESIVRLKEADSREANKKANMQRLSILANLGGYMTPTFMRSPPQEELLERYFHPDHMSSAEKMKLELSRVRDKFKMHESDCGSARVQVAQLTTKIKHLSSVLHKKDKHSRKGLQEMVQKRKKLLKYLRRTDWDSYCLVLSKLGLRDVPEYKPPDYKMKT